MRLVICALAVALVVPLFAGHERVVGDSATSDLTVVLLFKGQYSPLAVQVMEKEASRIFDGSGVRLDWHMGAATRGEKFHAVAVLAFEGSCKIEGGPRLVQLGASYGKTAMVDGVVQPFAEVDCNLLSRAIRSTLNGPGDVRSELFFGRALGRVVAHELTHIASRSAQHGTEGVNKPSLTLDELTEPSLLLGPDDADRFRVD